MRPSPLAVRKPVGSLLPGETLSSDVTAALLLIG